MVARIPDALDMGNTRRERERTGKRLADLERTDGSQYARAWEKIKAVVATIDDTIASYISVYSYTRAQIQSLSWLTLVPPSKGGTGTSNGYENQFTVGSWRSAYFLSDGTAGYAPSTATVKQDIQPLSGVQGRGVSVAPPVDLVALLALTVKRFRYIADVAANGDGAVWRTGFVAEDLVAAGLGEFVYHGTDGVVEGVAYDQLALLLHEVVRLQQERMNDFEARLVALEGGGL